MTKEKQDIKVKLKSGNYISFFHDTNERMSYEDFVAIYRKKIDNIEEVAELLKLVKSEK